MNKDSEKIRKEYDFSSGVRGKHAAKLKKGHKTIIHRSDGSTDIIATRPIILDHDIQQIFPDSKAVNKALRRLIESVPDSSIG